MVVSEGVKEIWLSSEDTGAYGKLITCFSIDRVSAWIPRILIQAATA